MPDLVGGGGHFAPGGAVRVMGRWTAMALALLFAVVPAAGRAAGAPVEIDAILSLTGPYSFPGRDSLHGLAAFERYVDANGGIDGRPIHFVTTDDQSSPAVAVQLMTALIAKHVSVVLGSESVSSCAAMAPLVHDGPVLYCISPGVHPDKGTYFFSSGISTADTLAASANFLRARNWRTIAVITSTDATGQDADRIVDSVFGQNSGITIADREHFNPSDVSVAAEMAKVKASGAQVLVAWTTGSPFGTVLRNASDVGLRIPVITTAGNLSLAEMHAYAAFLPTALYIPSTPPFAADDLPPGPLKRAVGIYVDALKADGLRPENGSALAWGAASLIVDALRKLGPDATATAIRDQLEGVRGIMGIYGPYDFTAVPQRGVGIGSVVMIRYDSAKDWWVAESGLGGAGATLR